MTARRDPEADRRLTAEARARDLICQATGEDFSALSSGDVVGVANLVAERDRLQAENAALRARLERVLGFLRSDSVAITYQTLGQYRTAAIDAARAPDGG